MLYPKDTVSDQPENLLLAELIREQVLHHYEKKCLGGGANRAGGGRRPTHGDPGHGDGERSSQKGS